MRDFRIGTDIKVKWYVTINEGTVPIEGADLTLQLVNPLGQRAKMPFSILDGKVVAIVYGKGQTMLGAYAFTLWLNYGKADQTAIDHIDAFRLVASSNLIEGKDDCDNLQTGATVNLRGMMTVGVQGASAYEIWLRNGHSGTEDDFLAWLKGPQGDPGAPGKPGGPGSDGNGIERIAKTGTEGNIDTYTIYFTDGATYEYSVKNGKDATASGYTKAEADAFLANKVGTTRKVNGKALSSDVTLTGDDVKLSASDATPISTIVAQATELLAGKQDALTAGDNITIVGNMISASGGGGNIDGLVGILSQSTNLWKCKLVNGRYYAKTTKPPVVDVAEVYSMPFTTSLGGVLYNMNNLAKVYCSSWDVSAVTNMDALFANCTSLTSLDVSSWDVSAVTSMGSMFYECISLITLDVSSWNVSAVTSMRYMFYNCQSLTSLDVSSWDVSAVTNMSNMFRDCPSLTSLDVSSWDVSAVTNMDALFYNCHSLTTLDVSSWDVSAVTNMSNIFYNCSSLASLIGGRQGLNESCLNRLKVNLNLRNTIIDRPSLRAVINGLTDLTGETSQTLTLGATLREKLTTEDIEIATNKNWIIA